MFVQKLARLDRSDLGGLKFDVRETSGARLAQTNARSSIINFMPIRTSPVI